MARKVPRAQAAKRRHDRFMTADCELGYDRAGPLGDLPIELARHRVLDTSEAAGFCKVSVPHWRRLYRAKKVPMPVRLTVRKYGWRVGDLVDWIEAKRIAM
jgi:predicted DNA-binding transcriptional regulator AlpA